MSFAFYSKFIHIHTHNRMQIPDFLKEYTYVYAGVLAFLFILIHLSLKHLSTSCLSAFGIWLYNCLSNVYVSFSVWVCVCVCVRFLYVWIVRIMSSIWHLHLFTGLISFHFTQSSSTFHFHNFFCFLFFLIFSYTMLWVIKKYHTFFI